MKWLIGYYTVNGGKLDLQSAVAASAWMEGELVVKASYSLSDEYAVLTLFGSEAAFGYGKATNPSAYLFGKTKLLSDVYDFSLSEPIDFDQPALFAVIVPEDAGPDADKAGIYWFNDERKRWKFVGGENNAQEGTISAKLSHFSKYALMLDLDRIIFDDIAGRWSENAVYRLNSIDVIDGYHVGDKWLYKPKMSISRQEFIKLLVTAADIDLGAKEVPKSYQDTEQVGAWAAPYINAALDKGWLSGVKRGNELWLEPRVDPFTATV